MKPTGEIGQVMTQTGICRQIIGQVAFYMGVGEGGTWGGGVFLAQPSGSCGSPITDVDPGTVRTTRAG